MNIVTTAYDICERRILKSLNSSGIKHRENANAGLWLGPLVGLCAAAIILREEKSYSEICLIVGIAGVGLTVGSLCLYTALCLSGDEADARDLRILYFLPSAPVSVLLALWADKGPLASVFWGLAVGTAGTWGVPRTMTLLPGCFTIGEATAVVHGAVLFVVSVVANLPLRYRLPPVRDDDVVTTILQTEILYVGGICSLCVVFPMLRLTKNFCILAVGTSAFLLIPSLHVLLDGSPLLWALAYVSASNATMILIFYWALCALLAVLALAHRIESGSRDATTVARKYFHLLAILVYIPGVLWQPTLLYLASGVVAGLFAMLELVRFFRISPLSEVLQRGFVAFVDEKDSLVSLTPLYLLAGLSFPLWMPTSRFETLPLLSGVLTVGLGDSAASLYGSKWGRRKWPGTNKSIEGTVACVVSQLLLVSCLGSLGFVNGTWSFVRITLAIVGVSLVEARTNQVDNLALPLLMYLCLVL